MAAPAMGVRSKLAADTELPFDAGSIPLEFTRFTVQKIGRILDTDGIRGTRSHRSDRTRTGPYTVSGQLVLPATRRALDVLLPMCLGGAESTDVFNVAETLTELQFMIDRVTKVQTYSGCKANRCTLRGTQGGLLEIAIDIEGETESTGNAGTFPSLTLPEEKPYVFMDGALTLLGTARGFSSFEIVVDNQLVTDRFLNSTTRAELPEQDRIVSARFTLPYDADNADLHDQALAGAAGTLVFTNAEEASSVLTVALGTLQFPARTPVVNGKGETVLELEGQARSTVAGDPDIRITNAHA